MHSTTIIKIITMFFLASSCAFAASETPGKKPQEIFREISRAVFQLKTSISAEASKSSYGSAFVISTAGYLATNYHVVSDAVLKPEKSVYLVLNPKEPPLEAAVVAVDVTHDLAIVKVKQSFPVALEFREESLAVGDRTFSLGLPQDLNMSIIEGIYNGEEQYGPYHTRVLSTPLNSGMSGGPTVDGSGKIVGVNAAMLREGQNISFLVPLQYLKKIVEETLSLVPGNARQVPGSVDFTKTNREALKANILEQLKATQDQLVDTFLTPPEVSSKINIKTGDWEVDLSTQGVKCWQNQKPAQNQSITREESTCFVPGATFISTDFHTAFYQMAFVRSWNEKDDNGKKGLTPLTLRERNRILGRFSADSDKNPEIYSARKCNKGLLMNKNQVSLFVSWCVTALREWKGLYNFDLAAGSAGIAEPDFFSLGLDLRGYSEENIIKMTDTLLNRIRKRVKEAQK